MKLSEMKERGRNCSKLAFKHKEWKARVEIQPKLRLYRTLKFNLHQEEYLHVIKDREERRLITALRGGTNVLAVETGKWKGEALEERTCSACATGNIENELRFLLDCFAYERERRRLYQRIRTATDFDFRQTEGETDWLAQMMLGVSCPNKNKRQSIQRETAKFVEFFSDAEKGLYFILKFGLTRRRVVCYNPLINLLNLSR